MNIERLYEILNDTTVQFRKGKQIETRMAGPVQVVEVNAMDHVDEAPADLEKVDLELLVIGVDKTKAEQHKAELVKLLKDYPEPDRLAAGPSYIEVGGVISDQGAAFQLFALGKVLGLWGVVTPASLGMKGPVAREIAGRGFVMITGYKPEK